MRRTITLLLAYALLFFTALGADQAYADEAGNYSNARQPSTSKSADLNIHFPELGNRYTGDCVYINYGNIDILIDAGSRISSAITIKAYIDNYIQDNKLEYVIATHGHRDHIAGFVSSPAITGIFESYEIETLIDFPMTNSDSYVYHNYVAARGKLIENGTAHYTALQCYRNEGKARRIHDLGNGVKLEILYNYFYENPSHSENNYSVVARIIQDGMQYLFTGDLETEAEDLLVDYYEAHYGGLGHCILYKASHHGSNTSGGEKLMAAISPKYICVCACAGTHEYGALPPNIFPSQGFIDRAAPYTDRIYITTLITDYQNNKFTPFNGNIFFRVSQGIVSIKCSNNDLKLKDSEWFLANRQMPEAWKSRN